jgi:hypothetical protein
MIEDTVVVDKHYLFLLVMAVLTVEVVAVLAIEVVFWQDFTLFL